MCTNRDGAVCSNGPQGCMSKDESRWENVKQKGFVWHFYHDASPASLFWSICEIITVKLSHLSLLIISITSKLNPSLTHCHQHRVWRLQGHKTGVTAILPRATVALCISSLQEDTFHQTNVLIKKHIWVTILLVHSSGGEQTSTFVVVNCNS